MPQNPSSLPFLKPNLSSSLERPNSADILRSGQVLCYDVGVTKPWRSVGQAQWVNRPVGGRGVDYNGTNKPSNNSAKLLL